MISLGIQSPHTAFQDLQTTAEKTCVNERKQGLAPLFTQTMLRKIHVRGMPMSWAMYKFLDVFPSVCFHSLAFYSSKKAMAYENA